MLLKEMAEMKQRKGKKMKSKVTHDLSVRSYILTENCPVNKIYDEYVKICYIVAV